MYLTVCVCVCVGLLGAAPVMPLLANPALSAALVQLLLQNQVQQVLDPEPLCLCFLFIEYLFVCGLL